jgi:hypothetical protein
MFFYAVGFQAQDKTEVVKPQPKALPAKPVPKKQMITYSKLSLKAGLNLSVIYLARNTKDNNNELGYSFGAVYAINNFIRISGLYTKFKTINIDPTWQNIKAGTYEVNFEILARFPNKKTLLYPFAGISYNTYRGFFTGQDDYLNLKNYYKDNTIVSNQWLGMNFGIGLEHNFGPFGLYIDYRMRVGKQEQAINIMDVCYSGGIKLRIPQLRVNGKRILRDPNDRFHWF